MNVNKGIGTQGPGHIGVPNSPTGEVGQLEGATVTVGVAAPRKSFKTQVKELFRDIAQFFKSLTQRHAVIGQPPPTVRSSGKSTTVEGSGGPMLGSGLHGLDLSRPTGFKPMSSGNGGALFVELGDKTVVVKGGGDGAKREVFGAMLARSLGLPAPETRLLTSTEKSLLEDNMEREGVTMPPRRDGGDDPKIVMEYVHGTTVSDARDEGRAKGSDIAKSFGKWIAFASFINEPDTFHGLVSSRMYSSGGGINSSNFMLNPGQPEEGIVGIDQNVGSGDCSEVIGQILDGSPTFFFKAADLVSRTSSDNPDPEDLMDQIQEGAREVFEAIAQMDHEQIETLGLSLGIDIQTIQDLQERQSQIAGH